MAGSTINTFDKGLHQDSSFILQPDGTYRNMKNGMLISYDGNHYTVEMSKGNRVILTLTPRYLDTVPDLDIVPMPIGFISFIDKLVVFSTNSESTTGYGEIGVISFTRVGVDFVGSYIPYYHHASLNFTKLHKIEGFSFRENDKIQRVYWTDNFNEPRVFDIANPTFTTYFAPSPATPLTSGVQYMVLQGAVTHGGINYGPGLTYGNIFTASGTSYVTLDGTPLVIEYFPLSLLDWTPTRLLGSIKFKEYGTGIKNCGTSIYFYRLSSSGEGYSTTWSYASNPIHVGMDNVTAYLTGNDYRDFVGNGTTTTLESSGKSVKVEISDIDTDFDVIELCCAEYNQKTDIPYSIKIVSKLPITSSTMIIEDNGLSSLGDVTIAELTFFPASILRCKTLATNKNYNIIADTTEREEFELDLSNVTVTQFQHPLISHGDLDSCSNGNIPEDVSPDLLANPGVGDIKPNSRYLVSDAPDASNRVEYPVGSGTYYYTGDVFIGVVGSVTATFTGTAEARPCAARNKYTRINSVAFSNNNVKDSIELTTGFWDYKDPAIASLNKGYWSDEKYRIGLLFLDLKGNPFYVKHLKDVDFDDINTKGGLMKEDSYSGASLYSLNVSAINISGLDIPETIMNNCSGFMVVRAERDKRILTQGLMTQNVTNTLPSPNIIMPIGTMNMNVSTALVDVVEAQNIYSYLCPDYLAGYDFNNSIGKIDDKMEQAGWLSPYDYGLGVIIRGQSNYQVMYSKMFENAAADTNPKREFVVKSLNGSGFKYYNENDTEANFSGTGDIYYNQRCDVSGLKLGVDGDENDDCYGSSITWPTNAYSVGCKKIVLKAEGVLHYASSNDYSSGLEDRNFHKLLINCLSDLTPSTQYGGTSSVALANTLYMSTGHFQPINAQVKADTLNGTFSSGTYAGENKYTFNNIEVFGGDCYTNLIDLGYGLWSQDYQTVASAMSYSIWFPCECNVNYNLRRGLKVSNKDMYPSGLMAWQTSTDSGPLEDYSYNLGYNSEGIAFKYPSLPDNYRFTGKFEYRLRWSGEKFPGELLNSFRTFRVADYRDVDGNKGQINNVKEKDSKLFYWQDHGVGYAPILERQLVGGGALGDATALGVTGVIDRYDVIDTTFGNQHQHGLVETEYGYAWFDMRNRAFMVMGVGNKPEEMSLVKGLQVFFNNEFDEGNVFYPNSFSAIYNTNNLSVPEAPLMGYGIVGVYDPKFKMTYMTFKYVERNLDSGSEAESLINRDFTIGYNHVLNSFVSFYDHCPAIWHNHNDLVLSANNPKNTKGYNADMPATDFIVGDTIFVGNVEYLCIKDVYIPSYPPAATKDPEYVGSIYWLAINKENEIYIQTFGADICKFYGKVFDHSMEIVVNAKSDMAVTAQNIQFKTVGPNWTEVTAATDDQTATDSNISSTNRNYRWIDKAWFSSLPLPRNGRLTDYYVKLTFVYKNYVTAPYTAKNVQKISQWLRTFFVTKR